MNYRNVITTEGLKEISIQRDARAAYQMQFRSIRWLYGTIVSPMVSKRQSNHSKLRQISSSRQPRSSTANRMRSRLFHQITGGMLFAACQTGVVICQSTDKR